MFERKEGEKMKKKLVCGIFCLGMVVQFILSPAAKGYAEQDYPGYVQEELTSAAAKYVKGELDNIREVMASCEEQFGVDSEVAERLTLAKPFVIYNMEKDSQEENVYFPLVKDNSREIVAVVCLTNTTVGWSYTISRDWAKQLTDCNYLEEEYLFYQSEGSLMAESEENKVAIQGQIIEQDFEKKSYNEKEQFMKKKMKKLEKLNVEKNKKRNENMKYGYSPSIRTESGGYYYCKLYNAKGQGAKPLCWAAAVATTVNYRKGKNYTAEDVANKIGVKQREQDMIVTNRALTAYELNYKYAYIVPPYSLVRKSIQKKRPVIISGRNMKRGHAVTVYGYREIGDDSYVMLWDSALNNGKGGLSIVSYFESDLMFSSEGISYVTNSCCYYRSLSYK